MQEDNASAAAAVKQKAAELQAQTEKVLYMCVELCVEKSCIFVYRCIVEVCFYKGVRRERARMTGRADSKSPFRGGKSKFRM
jgi:hypothetical protein